MLDAPVNGKKRCQGNIVTLDIYPFARDVKPGAKRKPLRAGQCQFFSLRNCGQEINIAV